MLVGDLHADSGNRSATVRGDPLLARHRTTDPHRGNAAV